jgi:hypothetical protein
MSELLPCPFCGEDEPESLKVTKKVRQPIIASQVECLNCGARGPTHYDGESPKSAREGAIWNWCNERTNVPPASVQDAARLRALASGLQGLATDLRGGQDEADELLGEVITTLRALAEVEA